MDKKLISPREQVSRMLAGIMRGEHQQMFETASQKGIENDFFIRYRDTVNAVKVKNNQDPEQMYLKGIFDGMRLFNLSMELVVGEMEEETSE